MGRTHVRDWIVVGDTAESEEGIGELQVKAGELIVAFHVNYSTAAKINSTVNPGLAIGADGFTDGWRVSGGAAYCAVYLARATEDMTVRLGPGLTYLTGPWGVAQVAMAIPNVDAAVSYYSPDDYAAHGVSYATSGRPYMWGQGDNYKSNISYEHAQAGADTLIIGSWLWSAESSWGASTIEDADGIIGEPDDIFIWDDTQSFRHAAVRVGLWPNEHLMGLIDSGAWTSGALSVIGGTTNPTGTPTRAAGVALSLFPKEGEYVPDGSLQTGYGPSSSTPGDTLTVNAFAGDHVVAAIACQYGSQGDMTPEGWTGAFGDTENGRSGTIAVRKVEEDGPVSFTVPSTTGGRIAASLAVVRGVDTLEPNKWQGDAPTLPDGPCLVFVNGNAVNTAMCTNFKPLPKVLADHEATRSTSASWTGAGIYYVPDGKGVTPTIAPSASTTFSAWSVIPLPAGAEPVVPAVEVRYPTLETTDGVALSLAGYWNGALCPARFVPYGHSTVASLVGAEFPYRVAHRGGSETWPQHTQRAYTQAVWAGAHALEISCQRTADGVWIGCHDKTLEAVGGPSTEVASMTWAEVQAAMAGSDYMPCTLEWLLDTYGASHVIVVDPKHSAWTYYDEYTAMLAAWKSRVILKFSGDGKELFAKWAGDGFTTWAYGYQEWATSNETAWGNFISDANKHILSLDGPFGSDAWAEALATGTPLTAHILTTEDRVQAAIEAGAVGAMVSGWDSLIPSF